MCGVLVSLRPRRFGTEGWCRCLGRLTGCSCSLERGGKPLWGELLVVLLEAAVLPKTDLTSGFLVLSWGPSASVSLGASRGSRGVWVGAYDAEGVSDMLVWCGGEASRCAASGFGPGPGEVVCFHYMLGRATAKCNHVIMGHSRFVQDNLKESRSGCAQ